MDASIIMHAMNIMFHCWGSSVIHFHAFKRIRFVSKVIVLTLHAFYEFSLQLIVEGCVGECGYS